MQKLIKGILDGKFIINTFGKITVNDQYCGSEIGDLQGWWVDRGIELKKASPEAYRIARNFLENYIIDMRNFLANIRKEDIVCIRRKNDGFWGEDDDPRLRNEYLVEITDERYAKYFEEYEGKKYLELLYPTTRGHALETYITDSKSEDYDVKTLLDWQEDKIILCGFPGKRYVRTDVEEDNKIYERYLEETDKLRDEFAEEKRKIEEQITRLEKEYGEKISKVEEEIVKDLPRAKTEFDLEGFQRTREMLKGFGKELDKEWDDDMAR